MQKTLRGFAGSETERYKGPLSQCDGPWGLQVQREAQVGGRGPDAGGGAAALS